MEELLFTPAAVLSLLTKIEELSEYHIGITETLDGMIQIQVGESIYILDDNSATDITVDDSVVNTIEQANVEEYINLADEGEIDLQEPVESGILSELAKTVLVGGLVRLGGKALKNWI